MLHHPGTGDGNLRSQTVSVILIERHYFAKLEPVSAAQSFF
jgi:hypothetical protein